MPLTEFICPDNEKIKVSDCMQEGGCRMGERCATRSYLKFVSRERVWTGKPSTTQLIRGSREAFLLLTKDYAVSPDSRAFMIHGTKGHANLESATDELSLLEVKFDGDEIDETGIADIIETENGETILADYKTSGSYKVAKALGFKTVEKETDEVYKSGKRKGEKKKIKELVRDMQYEDRWEWELQLNKYRLEWERNRPKITSLKIQCVVRDGNTYIARSRGVFRNVYYFKLRIMPDQEVLDFFRVKREALLSAIETGLTPPVCEARENWDGLKCSKYCSVAEYCSYGKYLKTQKQSEEEMIKGLSEIRRLPRLGKIRLGIKKVTAAGKEYPAEIDYFRLDPKTPSELENKNLCSEFEKLYGEKPKQIKIMFPVPDPNIFFPQFYKRYANGVLRCKGDGIEADCITKEHAAGLKIMYETETGGVKVECNGKACEYYVNKKCGKSAALSVLLPELKGAGVWEIVTGSGTSIININSCLEYIRAVCGRVHMIPLTLERRAQEIIYEGKKATHFILHINMDFALADLQKLALIDATRILLELPEPEPDKEDILFNENAVVNTEAEVISTEPTPQPAPTTPTGSQPQHAVPQEPPMDGKEKARQLTIVSGAVRDAIGEYNWDACKMVLAEKYPEFGTLSNILLAKREEIIAEIKAKGAIEYLKNLAF
jgi:hypothetical protein